MKNFLFTLSFLFVALFATAQTYRLNDTMYVWEMRGADLLSQAGDITQVIGKYYYGSPARVVDTDIGKYPARMEIKPGYNLQGYWVRVIIDRDTGYVFDGYLSPLKPFDLRSNAVGIELVQNNFNTNGEISKDILTVEKGKLDEGKSRDIRFDNGIHWNVKNIQSCLLETYTYPGARLSEAYQFMMAVYSNYFDQGATYMSEPEFLQMNGNKHEFIIRAKENNQRITLYKKGEEYIISSYSCR